MVFPADFEKKIGFDDIRSLLSGYCLSEPGRREIGRITFSDDLSVIRTSLEQCDELRRILLFEEGFPSQDYYDLSHQLHHLRVEGTYLEPDAMAEFRLSYATILSVLSYIGSRKADLYPELGKLSLAVVPDTTLPDRIDRIIDEKALIRDEASPELKKIRKERSARQAVVEKKIAAHLRAAVKSGWAPEDAGVTVRDGRLVIPLNARYKRQVPGYVHDESATGQTVYLEPADVLETNNEIREFDHAEHREIIRILIDFANHIRPGIPRLLQAYEFLARIDGIRARALLALETGAMLPKKLSPEPVIKWEKAVHPLLFLSHKKQKKEVVPLSLSLDRSDRILVISGPNAGGKSVCLKTAGLLQYMFQCGLLPPVREDSEFGIFENIFLDIGDEQSLENDLSTYTSKLFNLKFFVENLTDRSLFLIDEFGAGTDPSLGGAIAEAGLEMMNEKGSFGIVTTHYANLKLLAGILPGIVNGAMLFDVRKIRPLYQLRTGKPGSSFAFEIARKIGFPEEVLERAISKTLHGQIDFEQQLQELENEKRDLTKRLTEMQAADDFLHEIIGKYEKLHNELEQSRKEILRKANEEALEIVKKSNSLVERTIREIRESQAEKEKVKRARADVADWKTSLENGLGQKDAPQKEEDKSNEPSGPVRAKEEIRRNHPYQSYLDEMNRKTDQFSLTLDIRGYRADEAHSALQRYIDDAVLLNIREVRILHGKGNGILRQITRRYLASVREAKNFRDEAPEAGGSGITVVSLA